MGHGPRALDPNDVDSFLSMNSDGTVTVFCGKVDLGQGLRIAIRQIAGEELGIGVDKIQYVEGDTALTPDQGRTSGSSGIQRGGMQIRQAAATAREALIGLAAQQLRMKADDLVANDGQVLPKSGGAGIRFADLIGGRNFDLKLNSKAPLRIPRPTRKWANLFPGLTYPPSVLAALPMCRIQPAGHGACAGHPTAGNRRPAHLGRRVLDQARRRREGTTDQGFSRSRCGR